MPLTPSKVFLLNPETKQIYTPNTNQIANLNDELRAQGNPNYDDHGRFTFGHSGGTYKKSVDKSEGNGIIAHRDEIIADFKMRGFFSLSYNRIMS